MATVGRRCELSGSNVATAAEQLDQLVAGYPEAAAAVAETRGRVGRFHAGMLFTGPAAEGRSKTAWERVHSDPQGLSAWRMRAPDHSFWRVVVMGEQGARVRNAKSMCLAAGGAPEDIDPDFVQALKARRWEGVAEGVLQALRSGGVVPKEFRLTVTHFGLGALLDDQGRMTLAERPQG